MQLKNSALKVRDFDLSVKAEDISDDGLFTGYGSVANVVDSYNEIVAPGAFKKSLADLKAKKRKVPVLWQHRSAEPIGVYDDLVEDDAGLRVQGRLLVDHVAQAKEAHALMRVGAVTGLSIGYWVRKSSYDEKTGIRTLLEVDLIEVSLVTFPANDDARIDAVKFKLAHGELPTLPEFERLLREAGFSKTKAAVVAAHGLPHLLRSESGGSPEPSGADFLAALLGN
ncbi:HK97 family phage prohead protease [Novosphingobium sp. AP12]|uniref:HK97 family phage prohead protease n=1 Tax=Novosphingobium sp. AP12 TaxID=1144305 RepID=UPI0002720AEA|nr:HK97 family phage prohead protease [Novosphingobium sp. AP12]EJL25599.1 phage prohead protease, HK97 family [Novosphingobium sp. AP12]